MCLLRDYGFTGYPHYVVRPLGYSPVLNDLLMVEYCEGDSLGSILDDAFYTRQFDRLFDALEALASFLAALHNRTASSLKADPAKDYYYLSDLLSTLVQNRDLCYDEAREITWLGDRWLEAPWLWQDVQVLVHGDATPGNFLMGGSQHVTAIDLERVQYRDRVYDVGRVAGELVHHFLQAYGERSSAEPFITHFLHHYARHFPDHMAAFHSITKRLPFHMSLTLFRVARNQWLPQQHRSNLIETGKHIMRSYQ